VGDVRKRKFCLPRFVAQNTPFHIWESVHGSDWNPAEWKKNLEGTPEEMEIWLFKDVPPAWKPAINAPLIFIQAAVVAAFLQWGTTGAAVLLAYNTPVVGLGCVSGAYLLYGLAATLVWILLVSSAFLSHRYGTVLSDPVQRGKLGTVGQTLVVVIPMMRWLGKGIAWINAGWVLTLSVLQFAGRYQNCWCMSIMGRAGWVILWAEDQQIAQVAWGSWIGSATLTVVTVVAVTLFALNSRGEEIFERQEQ